MSIIKVDYGEVGGGVVTPATEPNTKFTYNSETVDAVKIQGQITNTATINDGEVLFSNIPYPPSSDFVVDIGLQTPNKVVSREVTVHSDGTITLTGGTITSLLTWNVNISYPKSGI